MATPESSPQDPTRIHTDEIRQTCDILARLLIGLFARSTTFETTKLEAQNAKKLADTAAFTTKETITLVERIQKAFTQLSQENSELQEKVTTLQEDHAKALKELRNEVALLKQAREKTNADIEALADLLAKAMGSPINLPPTSATPVAPVAKPALPAVSAPKPAAVVKKVAIAGLHQFEVDDLKGQVPKVDLFWVGRTPDKVNAELVGKVDIVLFTKTQPRWADLLNGQGRGFTNEADLLTQLKAI